MFENFFKTVNAAITTYEIRKKIFFSLFVILVFRLLAAVPVVGIDPDALSQLFDQLGGIGDSLSTVSGGVLESASVIAIGIGPYINASIIIQLLSSVIPKLEELRKEGTSGRRVITMYTRYLAVPMAIMQSFVIYATLRGFGLVEELDVITLTSMVATLTAGAMLIMWLAERMTENGIGNGSSYIIFLGIVAGLPNIVSANLQTSDTFQLAVFTLTMIFLVLSTIYLTQGERRVKIMYSRRVRSTGTQDSYIPIKLTQFGVLPVIFAVSLLSFPQLIAQFLVSRQYSDQITEIGQRVLEIMQNQTLVNVVTFVLVVAFSFFYVTVIFNPNEMSENLQKQGAFVPGIRPGKQTASYLRKISFRLTAVGGVFLGVIAVLPSVLLQFGFLSAAIMSGTGLLIVVGVVLDIKRQLESMIVVRSYDRYL